MTAALSYGLVFGPAAAAALGLTVGRRRPVAVAIALLGSLVSLGCALGLVVASWSGRTLTPVSLLGSVDLGARTLHLDYSVDGLTALVAVAVTLVTLGVQLYSAGYLVPHAGDTGPLRYRPFAATVSLFSAAMLVVIGADDLLLLLLGWEVMGFCSYLLIGHHSERDSARRAALQAFLVTRLADVGFVVGIVALYAIGGTTNIPALLRLAELPAGAAGSLAGQGPLLSLAVLGLVIGVMGKSAQFPFQGWLPDAMEGPTPVSALIHAATMVAAGVVVLVRLGPLLDASEFARAVLAVVAVVSMLAAGLAALCSDDLKRVLAWSTVSQIAVMLAAVTLGSESGRIAAIMLMLAHAAFKALLFLAAGMISLRFGTTALAGLSDLRRRDPRTTILLAIGLAGLAGLPPLAGFVGKEGVLTAAEHSAGQPASPGWLGVTVFLGLILTTLLTALYAGRLFAAVSRLDLPVVRQSRIRVATGATGSPPPAVQLERTAPPATPDPTVTATAVQAPIEPQPGSIWPAVPGPGPDFVRPPTPKPAGVDDSMSFVDDHGDFQDWDLIAGLDTSRPAPWSEEARRRRAAAAAEARRRAAAAGIEVPGQLGGGPAVSPAAPPSAAGPSAPGGQAAFGPAAFGPAAAEPGPSSGDLPPNRLARAMADRRVVPGGVPAAGPGAGRPDTVQGSRLAAGRSGGDLPPVVSRRASRPTPPEAPPPLAAPGPLPPWTMTLPVLVLAVLTVVGGLLPLVAPALDGYELTWLTAAIGTVLAVAGIAVAQTRGPKGHRDPATRLPAGFRAVAAGGFGYQRAQQALVVRPVRGLARLTAAGDDAVIGTWVSAPGWFPWLGARLVRLSRGEVTGYLGWIGAAAVLLGAGALLGSRVLG